MSANAPCEVRGYKPPPSIDSVFADYLKPMVLLALNTDLRRGDVFNLKWSDIDFREKQLKLEDATAKSGQTKHPPLNGDALKLLEDSKLQPGGSFVFSGPVTGDKFNGVNRSWEAFRERAGLTDYGFMICAIRSRVHCVMRGQGLCVIKELLDHSIIQMAERYPWQVRSSGKRG